MVRKKGSAKTGSRRKAQGSLTSEKQVEEVEKWMVKGSEAKDPKEALKYYKKAVEIEEGYRAQFVQMYPGRKIFSRLGEANYILAKQRIDELSKPENRD